MEEKFNILNASSKFAICGLPLRADTYKGCSFNCAYCFSNNRKIMGSQYKFKIGNIEALKKTLKRVLDNNIIKEGSFIDNLLLNNITWHCGGMSDPFQPCEQKFKVTEKMIELTKKYNISILFSTKSDNIYTEKIDNKLHTFQFSITNIENNKAIEMNVPDINKRYLLYRKLKDNGFKVGIRVQPFIPKISNIDIVKKFKDADYFTIEGIKLVPQNKQHKDYLLSILKLKKEDFKQMGLLNLKPEIRKKLYKPFIQELEVYNIPYSIADNDMHNISSSACCCGDILTKNNTSFNNTALIYKYGINYGIKDIKNELKGFDICKVNHLFASNRQEGCITIEDFFNKRFNRKSSPFSSKFLYKE